MELNKNNVWWGIARFIMLAIGFQPETLAAPSPTGTALSSKARLVETYGKVPLSFEENPGQRDGQVKFVSQKLGTQNPNPLNGASGKPRTSPFFKIARPPRLRPRQPGFAVRQFAHLSEQEDRTAAKGDWI